MVIKNIVLSIEPGEVVTDNPVLYSELVNSIKLGIRYGDNIPPCKVIPKANLRGRVPNQVFEKISAQYVLESGNHRAAAYSDLGMPIYAEPADLEATQAYIAHLQRDCVQFNPITEIKRSNQKGPLESRLAQGKFYRRN